MRIALVISELDRDTGGMGHWCWQFVAALAARGHELHVVSQRYGKAPLPHAVVRHLVPKSKSRVRFAVAAEKVLQGLGVDVIHDMGSGWHCDVLQPHGGSHLAWLTRRADMYGPWMQRWKRSFDALLPRHRDFVRHCRRQYRPEQRERTYIALSQTVADHFAHYHCIPAQQIAIVYNGVDCHRFSPAARQLHRDVVRRHLGVDDRSLLVLLAAHNLRLKGLPELLAVAQRLVANQRSVHLAVVGGQHLAKWRRLAARRGLQRRVTFVGAVGDPVPYYAAADAYVHPTYYDPCSLVLLEAAATGLPIVTTRHYNGAAELFREGKEILTVADPCDADGLFERVDALFDERLRSNLATASRQVALRHTFDRNVDEIVRLYQRPDARREAA